MDLVKGGSLTYSNRHKLRMTQTNPSVIPNDLIIRIIQEATTQSTLEYHIQRMEWIPQHNFKGYNEIVKEINENPCDWGWRGNPVNHEWFIYSDPDYLQGVPDGFIDMWIAVYTAEAEDLLGCPPTLELVLECVYQEKIDKLYPKIVPYLKRWAAGGNGEYGEPGYWGEHREN